jgi:hypothetical protein
VKTPRAEHSYRKTGFLLCPTPKTSPNNMDRIPCNCKYDDARALSFSLLRSESRYGNLHFLLCTSFERIYIYMDITFSFANRRGWTWRSQTPNVKLYASRILFLVVTRLRGHDHISNPLVFICHKSTP